VHGLPSSTGAQALPPVPLPLLDAELEPPVPLPLLDAEPPPVLPLLDAELEPPVAPLLLDAELEPPVAPLLTAELELLPAIPPPLAVELSPPVPLPLAVAVLRPPPLADVVVAPPGSPLPDPVVQLVTRTSIVETTPAYAQLFTILLRVVRRCGEHCWPGRRGSSKKERARRDRSAAGSCGLRGCG
jgi:hypothetical protein